MDIRIETGAVGLLPGTYRSTAFIHGNRAKPVVKDRSKILAGVFGNNDARSRPNTAADALTILGFRRDRPDAWRRS